MEYKSHDGTGYTSPKCLSLVLPTGISISVYVEVKFTIILYYILLQLKYM